MKKGFTIVELAIVLVVIGIILAMAVKGKALVDTARMKTAVARINKFEAAINIYYAKYNRLPAATMTANEIPSNNNPSAPGNDMVNSSVFIDNGILSQADLSDPITGDEWAFFRCNVAGDGTYYRSGGSDSNYNNGFCVTAIYRAGNGGTGPGRIPTILVCNIEQVKDDENTTSGQGRGSGSKLQLPADSYEDCNIWKDNNFTPVGNGEAYMYKVF